MHPQMTGRGARMQLLEGLIKHIIGRPGVTLSTCNDYVNTSRLGRAPTLPRDAAG